MTRYIIDRIEGSLAVLEREDDELITMPIDDLPAGSSSTIAWNAGKDVVDRSRATEDAKRSCATGLIAYSGCS